MDNNLETLVEKAISGDQKALEQVILETQDLVYNLSLKMLLFPEDAKDATQEILIKIITHLSTYRGDSKFKTWAYKIASNYLLTVKGKRSRNFAMSFVDYSGFIDTGISESVRYVSNEGELSLLEEEVKISCTHGLLLCLSPLSRAVYILGDILEINSMEGAETLSISPANFRKRLSRSREKIRNFLQNKCGLANPNNPCRCKKKIDFLAGQKLISINDLKFAKESNRSIDLISQISELENTVAIYQSTPDFKTPPELKEKINKLLKIT